MNFATATHTEPHERNFVISQVLRKANLNGFSRNRTWYNTRALLDYRMEGWRGDGVNSHNKFFVS